MADNTTPAKQSNTARNILLIAFGIILVGFTIYFFVSSYTKSEGEQAGVLINFSKKGLVIKTYEGELNIGGTGNVPGTAQFNDHFLFSVRDAAVAEEIMKYNGKKVSVHYRQVVNSFFWQGETNIWVDGVKVIQ
ncbi:MAG: hypothetical protein IPH78_09985 [Bacteroidetes bacterium]|nr:hypothetical protein [Bacteroidota bacterium]MBK8659792.1 hypothetical protein [Bacteroidota bacterium]